MTDEQIVELYWARSESAIARTAEKYGTYCHCIADQILRNRQDSQECVNDTYLRAWDAMPPSRPGVLKTFLGKITRNLALDRVRRNGAQKRNSGVLVALEELGDCVSAGDPTEQLTENAVITDTLNRFLAGLPATTRILFLQRYWYFRSVRQIAADQGISESKVKTTLFRARSLLKKQLEEEGIVL